MKRKAIPKKTREFVMERDEHKCTRCGIAEELVIHHELPVSEGGGVEPENLKVLCMACHKAVHIERGDEYAVDMASTRSRLIGRVPDHIFHSTDYRANRQGLMVELGLTHMESNLAVILFTWNRGVPSLYNLVKNTIHEELDIAAALIGLRDKGLLIVTPMPGRPPLYRMKTEPLAPYIAVKTTYYGEGMSVVLEVQKGNANFWSSASA